MFSCHLSGLRAHTLRSRRHLTAPKTESSVDFDSISDLDSMGISKSLRWIDGLTPKDLVGSSSFEHLLREHAVVLLDVEGNALLDGGEGVEAMTE